MFNPYTGRLIARKLSGEATDEELEQLNTLIGDQPELAELLSSITSYWKATPGESETPADSSADLHFRHILDSAREETLADPKSGRPARMITLMKRLMIAAAIVAAVAMVVLFALRPAKLAAPLAMEQARVRQNTEVVARPGVRSKLILSDGSCVWLNSDSRLVYHRNFNTNTREVELEGEAFFSVVKDAQRPFIVHTSGMIIKVLGTSFNVKSYPRENTIEATLIHGSIEVMKKKEPQAAKVILRSHEKLIFKKDLDSLYTVQLPGSADRHAAGASTASSPDISIMHLPANVADSSLEETSYVYNKLLFDGDTFAELAVKMERWFNVRISLRSEKIATYRFRGVFENENIDEALRALQLTAPFTYKIENNDVIIDRRK